MDTWKECTEASKDENFYNYTYMDQVSEVKCMKSKVVRNDHVLSPKTSSRGTVWIRSPDRSKGWMGLKLQIYSIIFHKNKLEGEKYNDRGGFDIALLSIGTDYDTTSGFLDGMDWALFLIQTDPKRESGQFACITKKEFPTRIIRKAPISIAAGYGNYTRQANDVSMADTQFLSSGQLSLMKPHRQKFLINE